jgi:hypothetical protein
VFDTPRELAADLDTALAAAGQALG